MPSHGGSPKLTDLEIGRAVAYMVNQSGGKWVEPASAKDMAAERSGAAVVKMQCAKCHEKGVGGAPKIGDRAAWAPRLKDGLDSAVNSAIRGHGGMPPRGNKADLTDAEIKSAINYMFNPAVAAPAKAASAKKAEAADPAHKSVGGLEIYLGVLPAESLRTRHAGTDADKKMYGGVPSGTGYFLVNVTLRDSATKAEIKDAQIEARVANPMSGETRKLETATFNNSVSYGNYFRMPGKDAYTVTLQIRKAGAASPLEVKYDIKP
jgi:cytochrome c5